MATPSITIDTTIKDKGLKELEKNLKSQETALDKINSNLASAERKLADLDARYDELVKNARELASITGMSDAQADAYITQQAGKEGA
ncbi:MAG: hypothetical protein KBS75_09380, partial [Bacteroidales bacterium]|nr:hypothetical protein [Candidatus Equimonas faecalis]